MTNCPEKASLEEVLKIYHYTVLPLLVETDRFLKALQGKRHVKNTHPSAIQESIPETEDGFDYNGLYAMNFI